jgi:DNA-binding transcriptional LysR family regulator
MRFCMDAASAPFDWNQVRAFVASAALGSHAAAARTLGVAQPTVGRQVAGLEQALGVVLFERQGHRLRLTAAGRELLEPAKAMAEAAQALGRVASGQATEAEGTVTITASEAVSAWLLPPIIERLRAEHPRIELELVASNQAKDLHHREADIAVRNFRAEQPELISRRLPDTQAGLYATPEYLARVGPIEGVADLARAEIFAFDRGEVMLDALRRLGLPVTRAQMPIATGNHLVQWALCLRGLGLCFMMTEVGDAEPRVRRILAEQAVIPVPMYLVCHRELRTSRRIRVVYDALVEGLMAR